MSIASVKATRNRTQKNDQMFRKTDQTLKSFEKSKKQEIYTCDSSAKAFSTDSTSCFTNKILHITEKTKI